MSEDSSHMGAWYFITETNVIKNLERMPIHHKIKPQERKRIKRATPRQNKAENRQMTASGELGENTTISHNKRHILLSESESTLEGTYDEDDLEESFSGEKQSNKCQSVYDKVYISACRLCKVKPRASILNELSRHSFALKDTRLSAEEAEPLAYALSTNTLVKEIDFSNNCIENNGFIHINRMLEENKTVSTLNLSNNKFEKIILGNFFRYVRNSRCLQVLSLEGNQLDDDDACVISDVLEINGSLTELNLSHNKFKQKAGIYFSKALEKNKSMSYLDLSWNNICKDGAVAIAESLKVNISLRQLDLSWNGFSTDGCEPFRRSLVANNTLQELNLSSNRIGYDGAKYLAQALSANVGLKLLKLNLNSISTLGAFEIVSALTNNPDTCLEKLEMKGVAVSRDTKGLINAIQRERPTFSAEHDIVVLSEDPIH